MATATSSRYRYLDPGTLSQVQNLGLAARTAVEGFYAGLHKSPHKGFSVEFAEHREYTPGIDPKHIDWRVFGRRDKLYVKQYEEETSLRCHVVLDKSASMGYRLDGALTKLEYGSYLAACLAWLMAMQHDTVGLMTCDDQLRDQVPPRQGAGHLKILMELLEQTEPGNQTNLGEVLHRLAETVKRRSLIVVISDLLDDPDQVVAGLKHFRHSRHDVIVFHVLDPAELTFPFDDISRIEDMETGRELTGDPQAFRNAWMEELEKFLDTIRRGCRSSQIDYVLARTDSPLDRFLGTYLARRSRAMKK